MKHLATRTCTFAELLKRIDLDNWRVHRHGPGQYTFVPIQYWRK